MRISDWSSDVCSSDLPVPARPYREAGMEFDWSVIIDALPALLGGARLTILIALAGLVGGLVVGFIAGLMRAYGNALLNAVAFTYIELVRGTPIVVQDRKSTRLNSSH